MEVYRIRVGDYRVVSIVLSLEHLSSDGFFPCG